MELKPLEHNPLGTDSFPTNVPTQLEYIFPEIDGRAIKFKRVTTVREGDPDLIFPDRSEFERGPITDLLNIEIRMTCFVQITLINDKYDWFWRPEDAITTAVSRRNYYRQLRYLVGKTWLKQPSDDGVCHTIRFGAVYRGGQEGPKDPFNMNVILDWGSDGLLPITIDPDLQNPKT
ncbi:MAG TPA: nucleotide synthetase [Allosphingosinicella sp.]|jgi:hypothetical protein